MYGSPNKFKGTPDRIQEENKKYRLSNRNTNFDEMPTFSITLSFIMKLQFSRICVNAENEVFDKTAFQLFWYN